MILSQPLSWRVWRDLPYRHGRAFANFCRRQGDEVRSQRVFRGEPLLNLAIRPRRQHDIDFESD